MAFPAQLLAVGVIVYVAVAALALVVDNVCAIGLLLPVAGDKPEMFAEPDAVHAYVVPPNELDNAMLVAPPEQNVIVFGVAVATGFGFTVIFIVGYCVSQVPTTVHVYVVVVVGLTVTFAPAGIVFTPSDH